MLHGLLKVSLPTLMAKEAGQIVWSISPQGRNLSHILCVSCEMLQKKSTFIFIFIFFPVQTLNKKTTLHRIVLFFGVVFSIKGHWLTRLIAHKLKFIFSEKTTKYKKNLPLRFDVYLKSAHFKNTVALSSVLSKLWSFSIIHRLILFWFQLMYY